VAIKKSLRELTDHNNIAELLDEDTLNGIGSKLCAAIKADDMSREKWLKDNDRWLKLAQQVMEEKSYPWQGASNVKYPTLSIAAIQFHAQAFPTLLGGKEIVKAKVIGEDGKGLQVAEGMDEQQVQQILAAKQAKRKRAARVGKFMSLQTMDLMEGWVDDMDWLLLVLPIVGLVYKKTYWSELRNKVVSDTLSAQDVILNYHAKSYERARITHRIWMDDNEIYEMKASDAFLDVDLGSTNDKEVPGTRDKAIGLSMVTSETEDEETAQREIYESHTWLDLDDDGYKEPYIVTLDADTCKVLRIVARWRSEEDLIYNGSRLVRIVPEMYFTPYRFLPDPQSKVYAQGFGRLLGPTNAAVNSILNMLMDSGHISTLGGGFIGRGANVPGGSVRRKPGEWIKVQATGDDLKKHIVPFPDSGPSPVLFQLLGLLINAGKDISTVQDINLGRNPGQNQPFATTQEVISEGKKVFNGIYKRVYRSLSDEFRKIYALNHTSLPKIEYLGILDDPEASDTDFSPDGLDIIPSAEPDMIAEMEKITKNNALIGKIQAGMPLNMAEVTRRALEAEGHEDIEALLNVPPPPPSPEMLKLELEHAKFQHQQVVDQANLVLDDIKVRSQAMRDEANSIAVIMQVQVAQDQADTANLVARLDAINKERDSIVKLAQDQTKVLIEKLKSKNADKDRESNERVKANAASRKATA
jgi:chaperonin GroES